MISSELQKLTLSPVGLTTRTQHWFLKRGFVQADPDQLPEARRRMYNWDRKSLVLVKRLL